MTEFTDLIDVCAERLGGAVLVANDEFFAPRERLLLPNAPEWREGVYTERGKWMDGWETRRRRTPGHDWCIVRLGIPALLRGVVVDTTWFRGNYPESCSLDATDAPHAVDPAVIADEKQTRWESVLGRTPLAGDSRNQFALRHDKPVTHVRLNIFPDGGVARLRVHGDVLPDRRVVAPGRETNLAALEQGAFVMVCSDMFFGHRQNLILPGRSLFMGDGWETKRRRGPGHDWSVIRLAARGSIRWIEIDTEHFKGNAPESFSIDVVDASGATINELSDSSSAWKALLARTPLQPHTRHRFDMTAAAPATHARLNIFPDGGVARLRLFGEVSA